MIVKTLLSTSHLVCPHDGCEGCVLCPAQQQLLAAHEHEAGAGVAADVGVDEAHARGREGERGHDGGGEAVRAGPVHKLVTRPGHHLYSTVQYSPQYTLLHLVLLGLHPARPHPVEHLAQLALLLHHLPGDTVFLL